MHDQLWAPWRLGYIRGERPVDAKALSLLPGADPGCFMCRAVADAADRENLVVFRGRHTLAILNRYPYNNGHLLVAPQSHQARLDQISAQTHAEAIRVLSESVAVIERTMNAQGFNIGLNLGHVAGAGVPGHLHWHLVPRWSGDTNFMPVLAGVDVIPQALDAVWELLSAELARSPLANETL
ncbi:MAG TPA: HIT domain-containing protein [Pirellulales bacterium]|jgi:ATP adenylyltransferase|nr:HIT domain-containing protein [Pirellulales bacterium]